MLKFGTDGVRGVAGSDLTPELVVALGRAATRVLGGRTFLVGRDTRVSGPMLQAALSAGLAAEGADVVDLGVVPTPGVAHLSQADGVAAAVLSASHNPFPDNGIKLFAPGGMKLDDDVEEALEAELASLVADPARPRARSGADVGRLRTDPGGLARYEAHLASSLGGRRLDGMRVVLDAASGAASGVAQRVLGGLGVVVDAIDDPPDGTNINDGSGSTHPERLREAVVRAGADAGLAFDGDADRVLAVDHRGDLVDGDQVLALCALDLRARGALAEDTVVTTVMANLGFRTAMRERGLRVVETKVGDRYVLEALEAGGWSLGGEQSGHIIFRRLATTGDGVLTGLQLLDLVRRAGRPLADLAAEAMTRLPQVLRNVAVADLGRLEAAADVWDAVHEAEAELGACGRVLLRASGTEPLVRVMVEAPTTDQARAVAARLCAAVEEELGAPAR